jgi:hypothetical protein
LEKEAAELTAQNLRLEAAIAPRRLSEKQEKSLAALNQFSGRLVEIKSYSSDTEGLILATQIVEALKKAHLDVADDRLTMQPAGSIFLGVSVEGTDKELVGKLKTVLSVDGNLMSGKVISSPERPLIGVEFGKVQRGIPAATILVGAKPIK